MTEKQKKFITGKLSRAILREYGKGFGMGTWRCPGITPGYKVCIDGVPRKAPSCGTVACIGGTLAMLVDSNALLSSGRIVAQEAPKYMGLTPDEADGLFFNYGGGQYHHDYCWPQKFVDDFVAAKTAYRKAKVAVALLAEVARTEGKCLHNTEVVK
jgi:hypothetical protein